MDPGSGSTPDPRDSGPIAQARAVIEHWEGSHERVDPLTEADVRAVLDEAPTSCSSSTGPTGPSGRPLPVAQPHPRIRKKSCDRAGTRPRGRSCVRAGRFQPVTRRSSCSRHAFQSGDGFFISSALQNWAIGVSWKPGSGRSYGAQNRRSGSTGLRMGFTLRGQRSTSDRTQLAARLK
jgi:hypothetical protein